jgi:transcriptional regulator with XRE-family HTH domain
VVNPEGIFMADPLDVEIGCRIREMRIARAMSQSDLANALGISFQQVQKYERGTNRVGSGRLFRISRILEVPVSLFFENLAQIAAEGPEDGALDARMPRDSLRVAAMLESMPDCDVKSEMIRLIRVCSKPR